MGSPPQGFIANSLAVNGFAIKIGTAGQLGLFLPSGLQIAKFDSTTSPAQMVWDGTINLENTPGSGLVNVPFTDSNASQVAAAVPTGFSIQHTINNLDVLTLLSNANPGNTLQIFNQAATQHSDLQTDPSGNLTLVAPNGATTVKFDTNNNVSLVNGKLVQFKGITALGFGLAPIFGLDNRSGLVAADGSPITLYAVPAGAGQLFRTTADIFATAFTSGTATYTITWTENAVTRTLVVTATALNTLGTGTDLINADASTNITAQLTGVFTATVKVASVVEQLA